MGGPGWRTGAFPFRRVYGHEDHLAESHWQAHGTQHGVPVYSLSYARDWFRRSIEESQSTFFMTIDERRESRLRLLDIQNAL